MKILHTADWHIGKSLYKHSLKEEMSLFFDWLIDTIKAQEIDLVLVSGDIFDLANPSNADRQMYYGVLSRLSKNNITCIITAGNHDSPSLLESPKALLLSHDIYVIGTTQYPDQQIIRIENKEGTESAVILAVPFLRDSNVRKAQAGESYDSRIENLRQGITNHYQLLKKQALDQFPGQPILAMGHLYIQGSRISDSERDIHIGNQAGISKEQYADMFDYFALGHIHRPQQLNEKGNLRYSGSPIALSFSERKDEKQVIIFEIHDSEVQNIRSVQIPKFRELKRFVGPIEEVKQSLKSYRHSNPLQSLVEIHIREKYRDQSKILETIALTEKKSAHYEIINYKIEFEEKILGLSESSMTKQIEELQPRQVFETRMKDESLSEEDIEQVYLAFDSVYQSVTEE